MEKRKQTPAQQSQDGFQISLGPVQTCLVHSAPRQHPQDVAWNAELRVASGALQSWLKTICRLVAYVGRGAVGSVIPKAWCWWAAWLSRREPAQGRCVAYKQWAISSLASEESYITFLLHLPFRDVASAGYKGDDWVGECW